MARKIAPSILSADFSKLGEEVKALVDAGADWIHVDVMDGHFVPNLTLGAPILRSLRPKSSCFFDVHLMIERPEDWAQDYLDAGADLLTCHIEAVKDFSKFSKLVKQSGKKVGVSLKPSTAVESLTEILETVDLVLVMTVEPGFGGQSFMENQLSKIKQLSDIRLQKGLSFLIEVDGGINQETAKLCAEQGADVFVAGSYIFSNDYKTAMDSLR